MAKKKWYVSLFLLFFLGAIPAIGVAAANPIADIVFGPNSILIQPKINHNGITLRVAGPGNMKVERYFKSGSTPYLEWDKQLADGSYTYELWTTPAGATKSRDTLTGLAGTEKTPSITTASQSGYFRVVNGTILTTVMSSEIGNTVDDIVHADDVIIDGSLCVGNDCYSGYAFGFDTIVLQENNLRIFFDDTSTLSNYPANDWRIVINDSTDGGASYFAIQDATGVENIFVTEAGAPSNSLYVDGNGDVGIGTATPYYELHINDGDSPAVRLEQNTSWGWPSQKWDLCGNESNFFIRDATHASKLPFRIVPDTPTDTLFLDSNGRVGIGTGAPESKLEVETTGEDVQLLLDRTDGAEAQITAKANVVNIGSRSNHQVRFFVNQTTRATLHTDGSFAMASGAECTAAGVWQNASSIELKENIESLGETEALEALDKLNPVKYNYKIDKEEQYLGFIAEDVPELVATKSRKTMSPMDVVALLTKVVQDQRRTLDRQQRTIEELTQRITELDKKLSDK